MVRLFHTLALGLAGCAAAAPVAAPSLVIDYDLLRKEALEFRELKKQGKWSSVPAEEQPKKLKAEDLIFLHDCLDGADEGDDCSEDLLVTRSFKPVEYLIFYGDGSSSAGWPSFQDVRSFEELWEINLGLLKSSCLWNGWGPNNSDQEIADIKKAINKIASETGIDNRFILSIVMQESKGCVRAPTTDNGVRNPGLMQSHNGATSCAGVKPCPYNMIESMIREGVRGTSSGEGLEQILASFGGSPGGRNTQHFFAAARKYNSGSVDWSNLNNPFTSTACYSMDVANRMRGWSSNGSKCQL